jgi:formyltetrahydrofolate-dependent phosphoribosylglycinamide formyltransferase
LTVKKKLAVLISGRGSNLKSLIDAIEADEDFPATIEVVIANKICDGLKHAEEANIKSVIISSKDVEREEFEGSLQETLDDEEIDYIILAGFMRILTSDFCMKWDGKIINIHPSILPSFKGLHTHERAIDAGVKWHGCTVHFVTGELDNGPIIDQRVVPVTQNDTPDELAERVLKEEHTLLPRCIKLLCEERLRISDFKVFIKDAS